MFSPALMSMMACSIGPHAGEAGSMTDYTSPYEFWTAFSAAVETFPTRDWPRLPVIGRTVIPLDYRYWFGDSVSVDLSGSPAFFWGRVPVDRLVRFFGEFRSFGPGEQYVDLGTPIRAGGSGSVFDRRCATYLVASSSGQPKVGAAIIDLGDASAGTPDDYNGRLRHAVTANITMSAHAEKVLSALLERLDARKVLADTMVSCALVRPPGAMIAGGRGALDQVNATEMLDAVKALDALLAADTVPTVVNLSLGTHVGPHNGDSPLEEYIASKMYRPAERFLVAAAGNDGGKGLAARRNLKAGEVEFLGLRTGALCHELLVEFWWDDSNAAGLEVSASIEQPLATGGRSQLGMVSIGQGTVGAVLGVAPAGLPAGMVSQSLFNATCRNNLGCIAFALGSTQPRRALPQVEIRFSLKSAADVIVNAWIVVAEIEPQTAFIEGGQDGTIMVPASDTTVLSVAGSEPTGQVWQGSSRGPAAQYQPGYAGADSPLMAHLVQLSGESGTSYSSPRACADTAAALADPSKRPNCQDAIDLICEAYGLKRYALPAWSPRIGYHKVIV